MTISVTGRTFYDAAGQTFTVSFTWPAAVNAGDVLFFVLYGGLGNADNEFSAIVYELREYNWALDDGQIKLMYFYKVANGDEGGTTISWSWSAANDEEYIIEAGVIEDCDLRYGPSIAKVGQTTSTNPDPPSLTPPWGSAENLWQALVSGDDDDVMTGGPGDATYSSIRTISGIGGGLGMLSSYAEKVDTAASWNPAAYTRGSEEWGAATLAWKGGQESRPVLWHSVERTTSTTNDLTIVIPAGDNVRLIVGHCKASAPTSIVLDPSGLNLPLQLVSDGVTSASHTDVTNLTTVWELPAADTPAAGTYTLRVSTSDSTQRVINTVVLDSIDAGSVESVTITVNDAAMASFSVNTVADSCTLLAYACRISVTNTSTETWLQADLDDLPLMQYGTYFDNGSGQRGATPMVRSGLAPGSHTLELVSNASSAVVAIAVVFKERALRNQDPIWWGTM